MANDYPAVLERLLYIQIYKRMYGQLDIRLLFTTLQHSTGEILLLLCYAAGPRLQLCHRICNVFKKVDSEWVFGCQLKQGPSYSYVWLGLLLLLRLIDYL